MLPPEALVWQSYSSAQSCPGLIPGRQGNEAADELAKEGAKEADVMPEDSRTTTIQEVKGAFEQKRQLDHPDKATYGVILQLQTGYSILNAHLNRVGINVSSLCACGALETTEHLLLECCIHEKHWDELFKSLRKLYEVTALNIKTLLKTDEHLYIPGWRETITSELSKYVKATGRFMIKQPASDQPRSDIHN
ncbi:hypothetical protein DPMN_050154 [Dreissena polymorpha]|uniref:RNase H type-1 domain-containing protein n=1 Tax=Dreissena polymorpha TaxID=45954 RepID=A0A9D4CFK5_DREPO|nr:hypothetical protein DPMN_050154 [Dreissena polymorpha]